MELILGFSLLLVVMYVTHSFIVSDLKAQINKAYRRGLSVGEKNGYHTNTLQTKEMEHQVWEEMNAHIKQIHMKCKCINCDTVVGISATMDKQRT